MSLRVLKIFTSSYGIYELNDLQMRKLSIADVQAGPRVHNYKETVTIVVQFSGPSCPSSLKKMVESTLYSEVMTVSIENL